MMTMPAVFDMLFALRAVAPSGSSRSEGSKIELAAAHKKITARVGTNILAFLI